MKDTSVTRVRLISKKEFNIMFPILTTKFKIADVAERSSKNGNKYVQVSFFDRGYGRNFWFPIEFLDFAQANLGKEVTADLTYFYGQRGVSLMGTKLY